MKRPHDPPLERRHLGRIDEVPHPGSRRFRDENGVWWRVYEQGAVAADQGKPCLIFESDTVARRVHNFPDDWRSVDDAALERLSWER